MILPSLRKTSRFLRTSAACATLAQAAIIGSVVALPLQSALAATSVSESARRTYAQEFAAAFPAGTTHSNASSGVFEGAVQKVALSHPADDVPAIAYTLTLIVGVDRAPEVATAIGKLFDKHPELREHARAIALAMSDALNAFVGPVGSGNGNGVEPIGDSPAVREKVDQTITNVLGIFSLYFGGIDDGAHLFPPGVQPGEILSHETPVINL